MHLEPEEIEFITDYLLVETDLRRADIGFVFGNYESYDPLADQTARLYHQGYFPHILVTGGPVTPDRVPEALHLKNRLLGLGVPEDVIFVEDSSLHTGENVEFGKQVLEGVFGVDTIQSVLGIGQIYASRRCLMTLERHWPDVIKMMAPVNRFGTPKQNWHADPLFRGKVLEEWAKLDLYFQEGFMVEVDMQQLSQRLQALPTPLLQRPARTAAVAGRHYRL